MSIATALPDDWRRRLAGAFGQPRPEPRPRRCFICNDPATPAELVRGVCPKCRADSGARPA